MCGIAGVIRLNGNVLPDRAATQRMLDHTTHRGPDGEGVTVRRRATLGARRLSIIDIDGGSQPVSNEEDTIHVVMNGEIYSYPQLRAELIESGHKFKSRCDTEVLVHGYEEWGIEGLLERLNGMFAFAICDEERDEVYLARDRLGVKPLFYAERSGMLLFASELKALIMSGHVAADPDPIGVRLFLQLQYIPAPFSPVLGVHKVPPACYLRITGGRADEPTHYWTIPDQVINGRPEKEWRGELESLLSDSVYTHLLSDVEVGVFLSGGVDSSILLGLMAGFSERPVTAFSVAFDDAGFDETPYAQLAAKRFGAKLNTVRFDADMASDLMTGPIRHSAEPVADPAFLPTLAVSREASKQLKVVQTGEGADELFAGYNYYARFAESFAPIRGAVRHHARVAINRLKAGSSNRHRSRLSGYPYVMDPTAAESYLVGLPVDSDKRQCPTPQSIELGFVNGCEALDPLNKALRVDASGWLPANLLTKVDRASMTFGLEARVPFLDYRFVELAMRVPPDLKRRDGVGKWLLRDTFRDLIGEKLSQRDKHGFGLPINKWLSGPLKGLAEETLNGQDGRTAAWMNLSATSALLGEHNRGAADHSRRLWTLLTLADWFRHL